VHNSREKPVVQKQAYNKKDQQNWASFLGIRMHYRPTVFPVNAVKVMRACCLLEGTDQLVPFMMAAFDAYWGDDPVVGPNLIRNGSMSVKTTAAGAAPDGWVLVGVHRSRSSSITRAPTAVTT
jgi:2-hydroxychromene-2-carboxylate isomerase